MKKSDPKKTMQQLQQLRQFWSFEWRWHIQPDQTRRVWRTDWAGDQFEVMSGEDFEHFTNFCQRFLITLRDVNNDE